MDDISREVRPGQGDASDRTEVRGRRKGPAEWLEADGEVEQTGEDGGLDGLDRMASSRLLDATEADESSVVAADEPESAAGFDREELLMALGQLEGEGYDAPLPEEPADDSLEETREDQPQDSDAVEPEAEDDPETEDALAADPVDQDASAEVAADGSNAAEDRPSEAAIEDPLEAEEFATEEMLADEPSAAELAADAADDELEAAPEVPLPETGEDAEIDAEAPTGERLTRIVGSLLMTSRENLTVLRLAQATNTNSKLIRQALADLSERLEAAGLALEVSINGDQVRLLTTPDVFGYLRNLRHVKKQEKLSAAALETLAVVAYRQPVIRAEIEAIRGVKAGPILRTLLDHRMVKTVGRADVPGRPLQYGTTQHFLETFGLESVQDLPSVKEFRSL